MPAAIIILIACFPAAIVLAWLPVKPVDAGAQATWQRRLWKLSAIVTPMAIAAAAARM